MASLNPKPAVFNTIDGEAWKKALVSSRERRAKSATRLTNNINLASFLLADRILLPIAPDTPSLRWEQLDGRIAIGIERIAGSTEEDGAGRNGLRYSVN